MPLSVHYDWLPAPCKGCIIFLTLLPHHNFPVSIALKYCTPKDACQRLTTTTARLNQYNLVWKVLVLDIRALVQVHQAIMGQQYGAL